MTIHNWPPGDSSEPPDLPSRSNLDRVAEVAVIVLGGAVVVFLILTVAGFFQGVNRAGG